MPESKSAARTAKKPSAGFSEEERLAMQERIREMRAARRGGSEDGEAAVLEKIAKMRPSDRAMAERIHAIVKATAPDLKPRTWYGMPAYTRNDKVVCHFQDAGKFKVRYATLGFSDQAKLDDGSMWPVVFALTQVTAAEEAKIVALLKRAL